MNVYGQWSNVMMLTCENGVLGQRNTLVLNFPATNLMQGSLKLEEIFRSERLATVGVAVRSGSTLIRRFDQQFTFVKSYLLEKCLKALSAARSMWNQNGG
jgi:hypothetical protein